MDNNFLHELSELIKKHEVEIRLISMTFGQSNTTANLSILDISKGTVITNFETYGTQVIK